MIKKFKEFNKSINIEDIIPHYEVEDQFLYLKEVLNYEIDIDYMCCNEFSYGSYDYYDIRISDIDNMIDISKINQIRRRIKALYTSLDVFIFVMGSIMVDDLEKSRKSMEGGRDILHFYIYKKGDELFEKEREKILKNNLGYWKKLETHD